MDWIKLTSEPTLRVLDRRTNDKHALGGIIRFVPGFAHPKDIYEQQIAEFLEGKTEVEHRLSMTKEQNKAFGEDAAQRVRSASMDHREYASAMQLEERRSRVGSGLQSTPEAKTETHRRGASLDESSAYSQREVQRAEDLGSSGGQQQLTVDLSSRMTGGPRDVPGRPGLMKIGTNKRFA